MSDFRYIYHIYGLVIGSELELPGLPVASLASQPALDVRVRMQALPAHLEAKPTQFSYLSVVDGGVLLEFRGVGRYLVLDGSEITIESADPMVATEVRAFLYGLVMGMLCLQRGLFPLHASAVTFGDDLLAFCGDSGAGKSTLAAHCLRAGARLVTDDLLILSIDAAGHVCVNSGMPKLRLWRDALRDMGRTTDGLTPDHYREEKYNVPSDGFAAAHSLQLSAIYVLDVSDAAGDGVVTPISGVDAVSALVNNTFLPEFIDVTIGRARHFANCVKLAASVPLLRLSRQRDPRRLPQTARRLAQKRMRLDQPPATPDDGPGALGIAAGANAR